MSYLESNDGLKIYYNYVKAKDSKPVLCFVHGWIANWTFQKEIIEYFANKGYGIVYFDIRGHGKSESIISLEQANLNLIVEDLKDILGLEKINEIILFGHSMGGMVSLLFTLKYQKLVKKLVLLNSSDTNLMGNKLLRFMRGNKEFTEKIILKMIKHTKNKGKHKELDFTTIKGKTMLGISLKSLRTTSLHNSLLFINAMLNYDVRKELHKIKIPVLVVGASKDVFFTEKNTKIMAENFPNALYKTFKGNHILPLKRPEIITKELELFIVQQQVVSSIGL